MPLFSTRSKALQTGKHGLIILAPTLSAQSPPSTPSEPSSVVSSSEDPLPIILAVKSAWVLVACLLSSPLSCNALLRITILDVSWLEDVLSVLGRVLH